MEDADDEGEEGVNEKIGDAGAWLGRRGNKVGICVETPGFDVFQGVLLERIFGASGGSAGAAPRVGAGGGGLFEVK